MKMRMNIPFLQSEFDTIKASSVRRVKRLTGRQYHGKLNEITKERHLANIAEWTQGRGDESQ